MRIAVLTNAYPPHARGGAGRIAALQVELLQAAGHEVQEWTASLDWTAYSAAHRVLFHLRDLVWVHPAVREMRAWEPEVLITHNLTGAGFRTPSVLRRLVGAKTLHGLRWVHVLHDVQLFYPLGLLSDATSVTCLQRVVSLVRRCVFKKPDAVVSPTAWLLDAHIRRGWFTDVERHVIPNPAPVQTVNQPREWSEPLRVLFVGRVTADKGSALLKELIQKATQSLDWRVIGPRSEALQALTVPSGSRVTLRPESSPEEILQAMREADVLLVPSQIEENQPTVILEAFACDLPVIGQAKGGIPETIGEAGLVVNESSVAAWQRALDELTTVPRSTWSVRTAAAWQRHAPGRVADALFQVVKSNKKM